MPRFTPAVRCLASVVLLCCAPCAGAARAGGPPADRLPRCVSLDLGTNTTAVPSMVDVSLFFGAFHATVTGRITLGLADPSLPDPPGADVVAVSVGYTRILVTQWTPNTNFIPHPLLFINDTSQSSTGTYNLTTRQIVFDLYLTTPDGLFPVPMPIHLTGSFDQGALFADGSNGPFPDGQMGLTLRGLETPCPRDIFFSTEIGFTSASKPGGLFPVSDGDVLSDRRCVIATNFQLTQGLNFMPVVPDLGLDALTNTAFGPIYFSLEQGMFSQTLGPVSDGDLLSTPPVLTTNALILRTNAQLIAAFQPAAGTGDVGLDAVHYGLVRFPNGPTDHGPLFFSVERDFFSNALGTTVQHGDVLSERGQIIRTNQQLLAAFQPACDIEPCMHDFGLDALFIKEDGEIWFSVEEGFVSHTLGLVSDGDLLSDRGSIVAHNLDLLNRCAPVEDLNNFGLDAADFGACPPCHIPCIADFNGDGSVGAPDLALLLGAWGPAPANSPYDLTGDGFVNAADLALVLGAWGPCP